MARRGTPIAFEVRQEAKRLRGLEYSYRAIARALGIDHHTAKKYAEQVSPKSLNAERLIA